MGHREQVAESRASEEENIEWLGTLQALGKTPGSERSTTLLLFPALYFMAAFAAPQKSG
jgi:hypothetical protein